MYRQPTKREYKVGDVLVFTGKSDKFVVGKSYIISSISIVDYEIDELDPDYGKTCIYFESCDYGCFATYADENFEPKNERRDKILKDILSDD